MAPGPNDRGEKATIIVRMGALLTSETAVQICFPFVLHRDPACRDLQSRGENVWGCDSHKL